MGSKYIRIRVKCYEIPLWVKEKRFIKFAEVSQNFNFFGSASLLYAPNLDHQSMRCEFQ